MMISTLELPEARASGYVLVRSYFGVVPTFLAWLPGSSTKRSCYSSSSLKPVLNPSPTCRQVLTPPRSRRSSGLLIRMAMAASTMRSSA